MAYFDNAATTYPKPEAVYDFMDEFYRKSGVNAGRGNYGIAQGANKLLAETRSLIKELLHCQSKEVIFTPTATIALNIILQGMFKKGVRKIYISPFEHNAVTRTLHAYESEGLIQIYELAVSSDLKYDMERIRYQFDDNKPDLVAVSHASNVIGLIAPIEEIFVLAKKYGAYTVADMSQTAGLVDCNIGLSSFDFAVFAGHKTLYGPTGLSGFVMNEEIELPTVIYGGTGLESANQNMPDTLPGRFEMGTINISGAAGLNAALKWNKEIGMEKIREKEDENRSKLVSLLQKYDWMRLVGNSPKGTYVGIVSCLIDGISSDSAGTIFSERGIAVRTGLQCAPFAHRFLGTFPAGTIRFSVGYFTSEDDFEELKDTLEYIEGEL
ncbi:aminotransferase class V-fold PLP-dependent enzyme [Ihubacter sp. mB4P-1]|uniref:aminotransferase class V-fold PLP-dependent enzyme n=1 Tax=Ihubacter sp. mB4P-1 TaxID=3242370 RepID=UPI003C7E1BEE